MNLKMFEAPSPYALLLEHLKQQHSEVIDKYNELRRTDMRTYDEDLHLAEAHGAAKGLWMAICGLTQAMEAMEASK